MRIGLLVVVIMAAGLLSRKYALFLPNIVNVYLGDALWATMVYFIFRFIFVVEPKRRVLFYSFLFCLLIEVSQLYHAPWIDAIRHTTLGGLILGFGFLWSDLLAYLMGVILGFFIDFWRLRL